MTPRSANTGTITWKRTKTRFETLPKAAPWYVVPADNKWFTRVVVAAAVIDALVALDLKYPKVSDSKLKELAAAKRALQAGK
jgi:Polyphosphate kinase 2 (PPK2)